ELLSFVPYARAQYSDVLDCPHPKRAYPAGRALSTPLVRIELVDVIERPHHVAGIVEHDHTAGTGHRTCCGERIEIHRYVIDRHLAFDGRSIGLLLLEFESLVRSQDFG